MAVGVAEDIYGGKVSISTWCPFCLQRNPSIVVAKEDWEKYEKGNGSAIELTKNKDTAEYLISGCCVPCWEKLFPADKKEESEDKSIEEPEGDPMDAMYGGNLDGGDRHRALLERPDYEPAPDPDVFLDWEQTSVCGSCGCGPCVCGEAENQVDWQTTDLGEAGR